MHQYDTPLKDALQGGDDALAAARDARAGLRRGSTPGDPDRQTAIETAVEAVNRAMGPIRSHIGRSVWEPLPRGQETRLRALSRDLQYERRQLRKMLR